MFKDAVLMLIRMSLHLKSREVSITTRSTPASHSFKDPPTKHTTVKWAVSCEMGPDDIFYPSLVLPPSFSK